MKKLFLFLSLAALSNFLIAQTVLDNNPTSIKWYQINTQHFRVLFPKGVDEQAQRMANTLERIHAPESRTLGTEPRKISVVLQSQSSISNAFVSITPRRSEFYMMPTQNYNFGGTNDWLNLLASHEYRHVVQFQHANRGFNRLFYYLFGATTLSGMAHAAAPMWFWEGDAVATETAFTPSGRGRIPNFGLVFKSNLMEGREFNYNKQYLRSYRNNIPDHYVLGYHMVSYLRKRTGDSEIWGKITARSWNVPFIPFAFSNAIKNKTGLYVKDLYREMANDLITNWKKEISQLQLTPFEKINPRKTSAFTDYLYPQVLGDGSVMAMKKGIGDIEQFVLLNDEKEEKGFTPGFINDTGMLSATNERVVWNEFGYDPRWTVRNYSLIKAYDFASKKKWIVSTHKGRYAGTAISPDGNKVVTVRTSSEYQTTLMIMDVFSGKVLKEFPNPDNNFYSMPRWSGDGNKISVLKTSKAGRSVVVFDAEAGTSEEILTESQENIGYPVLFGKYLFYNSPVSGIDNIYALDIQTKEKYQVTCSKYGAYNTAVSKDGKTIYYNEQTKDGLDVVRTSLNASAWKALRNELSNQHEKNYSEYLMEQEGRPNLLDTIPVKQYPTTRYSKLKGIINPYTWGAYFDNTFAQANVGISSQDILSTTMLNLGYLFDIQERTGSWQAGVSYQGLFPILDFQVLKGNRKYNTTFSDKDVNFKWDELTTEGGVRIPLILTNSKYSSKIEIGNAAGLTQTSSFVNTVTRNDSILYEGPGRFVPYRDTLLYVFKDKLNNGNLLYNKFTLSYYNLLKRSPRDFLYRWGQTFDVELYNTPYGGDFIGRLMALRSTLYFPGLFKHHFLYARLGYQESQQGVETNIYTFRNRIPKPRGFSYPQDEKFASVSFNYALPLWYPDISFGPLLNVQRIKANLFYDLGQGSGTIYYYGNQSGVVRAYSLTDAVYQSVGAEVTFDINIMRFLPKFELGFRTTYHAQNKYNNSGTLVEFLIGNIGF